MADQATSTDPQSPSVVVVMGVSGSGKTTIGSMLSETLGWTFADADSFHPPENIKKMSAGIPLDDADRAPWLNALRKCIEDWLASGRHGVLACSALKHTYRDILRVDERSVAFVFLRADEATLLSRLQSRVGHYMKPNMLQSQLATLEEPAGALYIDAAAAPMDIVHDITLKLGLVETAENEPASH